jgi:hypothetical protein
MDARMRLPREPYPGLRPYRDFEAPLLFGRDRQVGDIVERLASSQFVAVLGGSGSGKSSLVIAGVVPRLRSYGIPGAGDLWLPLVCTPGTHVRGPGLPAAGMTPLTRLAQRLGGLLRSRGSAEADATRNADMAAVLRQEMGLARWMDVYGHELQVAPGLDATEAHVLVVLDQFEEVFHPGNRGVDDVNALVQCVLDHFYNPHPRCHLVLTMRSEFLNDCAAYLELPDAINRSSYLVRRLDADELRAVITGPAQRFLRLMARNAAQPLEPWSSPPPGPTLPDEVLFEPVVVDRLLADATAIAHDPDHLPLLQHTLARLWQAAVERENVDRPVPTYITGADLVRAVRAVRAAAPAGDEPPLDPSLNTLRACIENWPESIYQWHDLEQRLHLERLLSRMGIKDPGTGSIMQQRLDVVTGAQLLGPGRTIGDLRALLSEGFLGSVDYFFWDDSDPALTTLKVSHESLIRGWPRFRDLIEAEGARFERYVELVRRCGQWLAADRAKDLLMETGELRRVREDGMEEWLRDDRTARAADRMLLLLRDHAALVSAAAELRHYLARSEEQQVAAARRQRRARRAVQLFAATLVFGVLLPVALLSLLVNDPVQRRVELLFEAGKRAGAVSPQGVVTHIDEPDQPLDALLRAVDLVEQARRGPDGWVQKVSSLSIAHLGGIAPVRQQLDLFNSVLELSEPQVNSRLRELLTTSMWRSPALPSQPIGNVPNAGWKPEAPTLLPAAPLAVTCRRGPMFADPDRPAAADLGGRLYRAADEPRRAVLVADSMAPGQPFILFGAHWDEPSRRCTLGPVLGEMPAAMQTSVVFDAGLRHFLFASASGPGGATLVVQEVDWVLANDGQVLWLNRRAVTTSTDEDLIALVRQAAGVHRAAALPTGDGLARTLRVGAETWVLFPSQPAPRAGPAAGLGPAPRLTAAPAGSPCARLALVIPEVPLAQQSMLQAPPHCLLVRRMAEATGAAATSAIGAAGLEWQVALYREPSAKVLANLDNQGAAALVVLAPFARLATDEDTEGHWEFDGHWLQRLQPARDSGQETRHVAPLSTCALATLAAQTLGRPGGC